MSKNKIAKQFKKKRQFNFKTFVGREIGWVYCLPVILGIIFFTLIPMGTSLNFAFHDYDPTEPVNQLSNFGIQNFKYIFNYDTGLLKDVLYSLYVTFRYTVVSLALQIFGSYCLALFLNQKTKGIQAFRIIYYLPCIIPAVAGTLLWKDMLKPLEENGYINHLLSNVGLPTSTFYTQAKTVLPTILFTNIFSWGGTCIMWLAQMQNIPKELYECAQLEGANYFQKTFHITIPLSTAMMFYVIVTSIIGGIQAFSNVYPLLDVAGREVRFVVVMIYQYAYGSYENGMSIACALSWVLFVIIGILTSFIFKTSKWVYYGEDQ